MYTAIRPDTEISFTEEGLKLTNEVRSLLIRNVTENDYKVISELVAGIDDQKYNSLSQDNKRITELISIINDHHFLYRMKNRSLDRENRTLGYWAAKGLDPYKADRKVTSSKILILGMGGTGSVIFQHLLAAGVKRITIVDSDSVELSNLNRQFIYRKNDVGTPKVMAAERYAREYYGDDLEINNLQKTIRSVEDVEDIIGNESSFDLAAICMDHPTGTITDICQKALLSKKIPCISGGVGIRKGFYGPIICSKQVYKEDLYDRQHGTLYSFGPTNTVIGALMAQEMLEYVAGLDNHATTFNMNFERYTLVAAKE
ncbi:MULTISPECIES: ThiF family adenylyltransferase [Bifidobacterium]|nr:MULTISPECIES: ThiF family adenylyltransferase [Bifidobacterium]